MVYSWGLTASVVKPFFNLIMNILTRNIVLLLILFATATSCLKDDSITKENINISVDQYLSALKSDKAPFTYGIPLFEIEDIPELLLYARDVQWISNYPMNPLSSYRKESVEVGFVVLWTIESIRLDVDYPSLAPYVFEKGKFETGDYHDSEISLFKVAELYENWWEKNKNKTATELQTNSPFEGTNLSW